jgi:DNA replication protein DnaC
MVAVVALPGQSIPVSSLVTNLTPPSACPECDGEGWVPAEHDERGFIKTMRRCECQRSARIARRIPAKYASARLSDFKAPVMDAVAAWLQDSQSPGLFLFGSVGTGKTHLAIAICRALLEAGQDVMIQSASQFYSEIRSTFNSDQGEESVLAVYFRAPWLLLDDVGAGALSDFERRYLLDLLDRRANRRTIITSNLGVEDFARRLDERIASRLREFKTLQCEGADRRAVRGRPRFAAE